jgi:hypothetical protein
MFSFLFLHQSLSGGPPGDVAHSLTVTEAFRWTSEVWADERISVSFPRPHGFMVVEGSNVSVWAETTAWHRLLSAPDGIISLGNESGTVHVASGANAAVSIAAGYFTTCAHVTAAGSGHLTFGALAARAGVCVVTTGRHGTVTVNGSLPTGAVLNVTGVEALEAIPNSGLEFKVSSAKLMVLTTGVGGWESSLSLEIRSDGENYGTLGLDDASFGLFRNGTWWGFAEVSDDYSGSMASAVVGVCLTMSVLVMVAVVLLVFKRCRTWKKGASGSGDDPGLAPDRTELSYDSESLESIASDHAERVECEVPGSPYDTDECRYEYV